MLDWVNITNNNNDYILDYTNLNPVLNAPLDAALLTVCYITNNYPPPYTLFLSGGIDSQAMLYTWYLSKVPFNTFSAIYNHDLNLHDLENLKLFSSQYNIDINYVNFDLFNFLKNEYSEYACNYRCGSPHICTYMKMSEMVNVGTCIFSGNFIIDPKTFIDRNNWGLYKFAKKTNKPLVGFFFSETEELAYSFLPFLKVNEISNTQVARIQAYQSNGFPVIPQIKKYTGFERVKDYYDLNFPAPKYKKIEVISAKQRSTRTFDLLYRNKYEIKFDEDKYYLRNRK